MPIIPGQAGIVVTVTATGFDKFGEQLSQSLTTIDAIRKIVKQNARAIQREGVQNVSGKTVTWSGGSFIVNRQSGNLARSINITEEHPLTAVIAASGAAKEYADVIERGVLHPVDLKPKLIGKVVPIRLTGPNGNRTSAIQFPVAGNSNQDPTTTNPKMIQKLTTTGKKAGKDYILFRKVTRNSKGWIIPPRLARPFMAAAAEKIEPLFARAVEEAYAKYLGGNADG